ncbi:hypothetical protein E8E14_011623 [Neopestalotiopsis sp. 37M]|nr:hypothetical protein E8E14_011623 [Neopestalotiopsis sp. 37M]
MSRALYNCSASTFGVPTLFGTSVIGVQASPVLNYSSNVLAAYNFNHGPINVTNANFCNVTVTYTHPGENDTINVEAWLPIDIWNGRFQAVGGGGWVAGRFLISYYGMAGALGEGYATASTDAGVTHDLSLSASSWALLSPGNINLYALQDIGSVSLNEMALFTKQLITSYYDRPAAFSYFSGCSQGGRQGLMLAQRYPTAFDGITASAPAINIAEFLGNGIWPAVVMGQAGEAPYNCELDAIQAAAITYCDPLDGLVDGLISDPNSCDFDPFSVVGSSFYCSATATNKTISATAALVANSSWSDVVSATGARLWYGLNVGSDLSGDTYGQGVGIAATTCSNGTCIPNPYTVVSSGVSSFLEKNNSLDPTSLTNDELYSLVRQGKIDLNSAIGTNDPDLSEFNANGGKMLSFHGLADGIIPTKGTERYYDDVTATVPDVQSFYRYFPAPGVGHCFGGPGGVPTTLFDALRAWCDEDRPACGNCRKYGVECDYIITSKARMSLSPIPTKASFFRGVHSSDFSIEDLELLHHYHTSTCFTFTTEPLARDFWQLAAPQIGFASHFILRSVLSISALHLSRFKKGHEGIFLARAYAHHRAALESAKPTISDINANNCEQVFLFTTLLKFFAFAKPKGDSDLLIADEKSTSEWLTQFRHLHGLVSNRKETTRPSIVATLWQDGAQPVDFWLLYGSERDALVELEGTIYISTHKDLDSLASILDALHHLQKSFVMFNESTFSGDSQIRATIMWLCTISDAYIALVAEGDHEALCVLAFYCVLLRRLECFWWIEGWGLHLIERIYSRLPDKFRLWIRWPIQEIGWVP